MLLLCIVWDDSPIFMIKWTATATIGIHPTKTWLSQLVNFKNAIWHFRRTTCNKILLKFEKKNVTETYGMLQTAFGASIMNRVSVLSGIIDWRKARSLWGMMRGVGWVRNSLHQSWLPNGLGLGLLCWGFKCVQKEFPREETSTLQIGSVAFPVGQYTSHQLHTCHRLFDPDGHQDSFSPSL